MFGIDKDCKEYVEAKRLLKFLDYFVGINAENIRRILYCVSLLVVAVSISKKQPFSDLVEREDAYLLEEEP